MMLSFPHRQRGCSALVYSGSSSSSSVRSVRELSTNLSPAAANADESTESHPAKESKVGAKDKDSKLDTTSELAKQEALLKLKFSKRYRLLINRIWNS